MFRIMTEVGSLKASPNAKKTVLHERLERDQISTPSGACLHEQTVIEKMNSELVLLFLSQIDLVPALIEVLWFS